ncbi:MAG: ADP-ribosylglycohydrolase family protein [Gammaproteobacteria bacterium]|nr:ADP-ribosylglycohydrolase family protein [Gammaproteobacteria bacterium]
MVTFHESLSDEKFEAAPFDTASGYIADTMPAVFQSFFDTDDLHDCLVDVVNRGGDADTTGAIAGMLAGAMYGTESIPESWLKGLDAETRALCEMQAQALAKLAGR